MVSPLGSPGPFFFSVCLQNLLSLLRLSSAEGEASHLGVQALGCLQQLCVGLRTRLRFHQDPGFSSAKQAGLSIHRELFEFSSFEVYVLCVCVFESTLSKWK